MKLGDINREHDYYRSNSDLWGKLRLLYGGGKALRDEAAIFLARRPKEQSEIYSARLELFTYTNHIGTALDWYNGVLFKESPLIDCGKLNEKQKEFYGRFLENCDRNGNSFVSLARACFENAILYQSSYVLYDLPFREKTYRTKREQEMDGALDPYLCIMTPLQTINWQEDRHGNFDWIVFRTTSTEAEGPFAAPLAVDRWYIYDREKYQVFERRRPVGEVMAPAEAEVTLVGSGRHLLADRREVPVRRLTVPEGLWLANRAYLPAVNHLNTENVLSWALFMSALAMPVVMTDGEFNQTTHEAGFIKLPFDSKYEWSEPSGTSFSHLSERIDSLTESIFRAFYLLSQGRSGRATPTAQSAVSKQIDMMPSKDILRLFGDLVRNFMQNVIVGLSACRGEDLPWEVRGFDFRDFVTLESMQSISEVMSLRVPSPKFEQELYKKVVKSMLPDTKRSVISDICLEIDSAPPREEREMQLLKEQGEVMARAIPRPPAAPKVVDKEAKK